METSLSNQEIMSLFNQNVAEQLASQPLYYSASKKASKLRRMLRENTQDIMDHRESLMKEHVEGQVESTMGGSEFVPETEQVLTADNEQAEKLIFKSDDDEEKFKDKWNECMESRVEGFPVIKESSLAKVEDDIRISGAVIDILTEVGLIAEDQ